MNWKFVRIEEVCEILGGTTPKTNHPEYWDGEVVWLSPIDLPEIGTITNICDSKRKITELGLKSASLKLLPVNSVVFSSRASIGKIGLTKVPLVTNQGFTNFIPSNKIDSKYLAYVLKIKIPDILKLANSTTFLEVSKSNIRKLEIPLPPLATQKRIAEILDKADSLRRKDQELLLKYDELTQAIFIDMFGDPVRNEKGWEVLPLGDKIKSIRYGTGSPPKYSPSGIPFIRATNIKRGHIVKKDMVFVSDLDARAIQKCFVNEGDLIIVRSGVNTGDCGLITKEYNGALAGYDLIVEMDHVYSRFYHYYINSRWGQDIIKPLSRRAAQPHLNSDQVNGLMLINPPRKLIEKFNSSLINITAAKSNLENLNKFNSNLFYSLLQKAFSGELIA